MKKPQYAKYSAFSITFLGPKSSAQILKKEFLEVAYNLSFPLIASFPYFCYNVPQRRDFP